MTKPCYRTSRLSVSSLKRWSFTAPVYNGDNYAGFSWNEPEVVEYNSEGVWVAVYEVVAAGVRHGRWHDGRTIVAEHPGQHAVGVREESGERRREDAPAHVQRDDLSLLAVHVW